MEDKEKVSWGHGEDMESWTRGKNCLDLHNNLENKIALNQKYGP